MFCWPAGDRARKADASAKRAAIVESVLGANAEAQQTLAIMNTPRNVVPAKRALFIRSALQSEQKTKRNVDRLIRTDIGRPVKLGARRAQRAAYAGPRGKLALNADSICQQALFVLLLEHTAALANGHVEVARRFMQVDKKQSSVFGADNKANRAAQTPVRAIVLLDVDSARWDREVQRRVLRAPAAFNADDQTIGELVTPAADEPRAQP